MSQMDWQEFMKRPEDGREPLRKDTFSEGFPQDMDILFQNGDATSQEGENSLAVRKAELAFQVFGPLEPFWLSIKDRYAHTYTAFIWGLLNRLCDRVSESTEIHRAFLRLDDFKTKATTDFIMEYISPKSRRYSYGGVAKKLLRFIYTYDIGEAGLLDPRSACALAQLYETLYHRNPGKTRDTSDGDPEILKLYRAHLIARGCRRCANDTYTLREFISWWVEYKSNRPFHASEVTSSDIWAFRSYLLGRNTEGPMAPSRKPATTSAMLNHVKRFFRFLSTRGHIAVDPSDEVAPIPSEARERPRYLGIDDCVRFLKALVCHATEPCLEMAMFLVAMSTGMRPAEVIELKVGEVSVSKGSVTFRRKKSKRMATLPLPPITVLFLKVWLQAHPQSDDINATLWTYKGRPISINMMQSRFKIYRDCAGIPEDVGGAHVFRHTLASHLVRETSLDVLQEIFGHLQQSTLSFYLHLMDGLDRLMITWGHSIVDGGAQE